MAHSLYFIAGETSGDALGGAVIAALKQEHAGLRYEGVGGEKMEAEGIASLFPYHELSLMGFAEVLPHLFKLTARINQVVEDVLIKQPDVVVTIDSPGFTFRVVKKLREAGLNARFVHLVAPSVWAYKPERAKKTAALFDALGCVLPFEPPYFTAEGLDAQFIGHPIAQRDAGNGLRFREALGMAKEQPLIALLPGSRSNEITRHMPIFGEAITMLARDVPNLAITVPIPARLQAEVLPYFEGCPYPFTIATDEMMRRDAIAASTIALTKSGTVTLDIAREGTPMVMAYRAHPVSAFIVRRMIRIPQVCLINILNNAPVIPEYLQEQCTAENLYGAMKQLLESPAEQHAQKQAMQSAMMQLQAPDNACTAALAARLICPA